MAADFIRFENVTFLSEEYAVLRNINVVIPKNRCTIILGASGCGKSTFLKVAAGIYPPDSGRVLVEGLDKAHFSYKKEVAFRKDTGFVFEDSALWANRTIFQNLSLPLEFHFKKMSKNEIEARVYKLLGMVNYNHQADLRPALLSSSEQKAVAFMRSIVTRPNALFLDEPVASLDHATGKIITDIIKKMKADNCTLIIVTNRSDITSQMADYLILLKDGAIVESGEFNVVKDSKNPDSREILDQILGEAASYDTDILDLLNG